MIKKYATAFVLTLCVMPYSILATPKKPAQNCRIISDCHRVCTKKRVCTAKDKSWLATALDDVTGTKESALDKRIKKEQKLQHNHWGIGFDEPTYVLPFYYTGSPKQDIGDTPQNQSIKNSEFKAQLSFKFPIWPEIYGSNWSLGASYTQLSYWQVYDKSQFFRETNYEPAVFVSDHYLPNWLASAGVVHQSNGRGGIYERSWNRAYADITFSGTDWLVSVKPWVLIFKKDSSDVHNKNIAKYLGYERIVVAYKHHSQVWSVMVRNSFESGFQRVGLELDYSFPIYGALKGYLQFFHGYGQSLIEYDHSTNSAGIGVALSNWI